jgi:hypothetical protein
MSKMQILQPLSWVLMVSLVTNATLPEDAQAEPDRVTCQTTVALNQGMTLTYRLAGSLLENPAAEIPQNPVGSALTLTV